MSNYNNSGHNDGGAFGNTNTRDSGYNSGSLDNQQSTNAGPHNSNTANRLDPRVDSDRSNVGGTGTTGTTGHHGQNSGFGGQNTTGTTGHSGYGNTSNNPYDNPRSTNTGPHDSNLANKADPRVDSDRDGRIGQGNTGGYNNTNTTGLGGSNTGTGYNNNSSGLGGNTTGTGHHNNNTSGLGGNSTDRHNNNTSSFGSNTTGTGHHNNNTSGLGGNSTDRHNNNTSSLGSNITGTGHKNNSGYENTGTGSGYGSTTDSNFDNPRSTNAGPHGSNLANKLDPRIDSNRDNQGGAGGVYGTGNNTGLGNKNYAQEDPNQISSNAEGHGNGGFSNTTSGGPHKSRLSNILDPRVDSNNAGSGTGGGPATASASVSGSGPTGAPEGQASASGPTSANANTTTNNTGIKGALNKVTGGRV